MINYEFKGCYCCGFPNTVCCGCSQPFSGIYLNHSEVGMYHCVCCYAPLFRFASLYFPTTCHFCICFLISKMESSCSLRKTFLPPLIAQKQSMTPGQAGHRLKRLMGHGGRMKATPPSFVALTTVWAVQGQRFFVKM